MLTVTVSAAGAGAVIPVSTTADDLVPNGNCTLREAIVAANTDAAVDACQAGTGADTVLVPPGVYRLTRAGRGEQASVAGDLDVTGDLVLSGAGAQQTVLDAGRLDRLVEILPGAHVELSGITLINGDPGPGQDGGGLLVSSTASLGLTGVLLQGNRVANDGWGGGLRNNGTTVLDFTRVISNTAGYAGGIDNNGVLTATHSTIANNTTTYFGGGMYSAVRLHLSESTVSGNTAGTNAGGLYVPGGLADLVNVTVSGNRAMFVYAGGIWVYYRAGLSATNTTITGNTAVAGAGIYRMEPPDRVTEGQPSSVTAPPATAEEVEFQNSLLANNVGPNCTRNSQAPLFISLGNNLDTDGTCAFDQPSDMNAVDAKLAGLLDNGGSTLTHALLPGSPAIDAGNDAACPAVDQRGIRRPADGDGDGESRCDIGAYEAGGAAATKTFLPSVSR